MFNKMLIALLLLATIDIPWLQDASVRAAPFLEDMHFNFSSFTFPSNFNDRMDSLHLPGFDDSQKLRKGPINYFASRTYQRNNVYGPNVGKDAILYGSQDVQIGNSYSGDPDAINVYGPILVQENNTYLGKNENAQYGASILRAGNSYSQNPGNNDIYDPIVIQSNKIYQENIKDNSALGTNVKPSVKFISIILLMYGFR